MGKVMNRFSNNIGGKLKFRLITLVFLEYAVWGAYLISIGRYLAQAGLGSQIKWFFATNGIVSLFMPALVGPVHTGSASARRLSSAGRRPYAVGGNLLHWYRPGYV